MEYELIKLDPTDTGMAQWLSLKPGQDPDAVSRGGLSDALQHCSGKPMVLVVPGEHVLMTSIDLPIRQTAKLRKAVPFALEEQLATDVESLHFALGSRDGDRVSVVAVESSLMNEWTIELGELGVTPKAVLPDVLALPWHDDEWSVMIDGNRALVKTGSSSGFVSEKANLTALIEAHLIEGKIPTIVRYWNCTDNTALEWPAGSEAPPVKNYSCSGGALRIMAQGWDARSSLNLLQDSYHQQADAMKLLKPWRWAAVLFGIWLLTGFGQNFFQHNQLKKEESALKKQAEQIYRKTFPQAKRIVNPRVQMEQKLKALKGGSTTVDDNFLKLLAQSSQVLKRQKGITLGKVGFKSGELSLSVTAKSLSQLDGLKQKMAAIDGLTAELKSADSGADAASAQIRIKQKL